MTRFLFCGDDLRDLRKACSSQRPKWEIGDADFDAFVSELEATIELELERQDHDYPGTLARDRERLRRVIAKLAAAADVLAETETVSALVVSHREQLELAKEELATLDREIDRWRTPPISGRRLDRWRRERDVRILRTVRDYGIPLTTTKDGSAYRILRAVTKALDGHDDPDPARRLANALQILRSE